MATVESKHVDDFKDLAHAKTVHVQHFELAAEALVISDREVK